MNGAKMHGNVTVYAMLKQRGDSDDAIRRPVEWTRRGRGRAVPLPVQSVRCDQARDAFGTRGSIQDTTEGCDEDDVRRARSHGQDTPAILIRSVFRRTDSAMASGAR